jgi:hypothetical protein
MRKPKVWSNAPLKPQKGGKEKAQSKEQHASTAPKGGKEKAQGKEQHASRAPKGRQ